MCMRIDTAGNDIGLGGVNHLIAGQVFPDLRNLFALDQDIRFELAIRRDNGALMTLDMGYSARLVSPVHINAPSPHPAIL